MISKDNAIKLYIVANSKNRRLNLKTKKIIVILVTLALGVNLFGCGSSKSDSSNAVNEKLKFTWKVVKTLDIKQKNSIGGFYDANLGMTAGGNGEVHYTIDAGATWLQGNNNSYLGLGLCIVNDKIAWTCGDGTSGNVRKTTDGGKNWIGVSDFGPLPPDQVRYLNFYDENTGWIASNKLLASTSNGGKTWNQVKLPSGIGEITTMYWSKAEIGYLIDTNNNLYKTKDSGKTWNSKKLNIKNINNTVWPAGAACLRFYDSKKGVFFYYGTDTKLKCSRTSDDGDTWKEEMLPDLIGQSLYMSADGKMLSVNAGDGHTITVIQQQ